MISIQEYIQEYASNHFFTPSDMMSANGLRLIRTGANMAKPGYHVGPRRLNYYSLHFVVEGRVHYASNGDWVTLGKGDLFCMFPQLSVYEYRLCPSEHMLRMHWLAFDGPLAPLFLEKIGITPSHPYRIGLVEYKCIRLLKQLIDQQMNGPSSELHYLSVVYSIFAELQAVCSQSLSADTGWVEQCIRYMQLHYTEDINVEQIAQHFNLHRSYVSTALAKRIGQSPGKYLQSLRLNKAAQLLRETDYSVTEIGLSVGYPDLYRFSRAFSRAYGVPPSEFRSGRS